MSSPAPKDSVFETQSCTRCGGSGSYSWNQMDGSRCYGCMGSGKQFTARGGAARDMFSASLRVPASEIRVGQRVWFPPGPLGGGGWSTVQALTEGIHNSTGTIGIDTPKVLTYEFPETPVRIAWSDEDKQAKLRAALDYQATLTKQGKPRKGAPA